MSERDWEQLLEEARVANTGDYVDRGVMWAAQRIAKLKKAAQAVVDMHRIPIGEWVMLDDSVTPRTLEQAIDALAQLLEEDK